MVIDRLASKTLNTPFSFIYLFFFSFFFFLMLELSGEELKRPRPVKFSTGDFKSPGLSDTTVLPKKLIIKVFYGR